MEDGPSPQTAPPSPDAVEQLNTLARENPLPVLGVIGFWLGRED